MPWTRATGNEGDRRLLEVVGRGLQQPWRARLTTWHRAPERAIWARYRRISSTVVTTATTSAIQPTRNKRGAVRTIQS